jgi:hypothetical protein
LYETLSFEYVNPSNKEVKRILAKHRKAPDDPKMHILTFVTFRLSNMGKEAISINDITKPLTITFKSEATILSCEKVETVSQDLEYKSRIEGEKILLTFPLLEQKESLTLRLLITGYIDYFPGITIRVGLRKRIVRANNVRFSKEMLVVGIVSFCLAAFMAFASGSPPQSPFQNVQNIYWDTVYGYSVMGLACFLESWEARKLLPTPKRILPSAYLSLFFKELISLLPILIPFAILSVVVIHWLGIRAYGLTLIIIIFNLGPLLWWYLLYKLVSTWLQKCKIKYKTVLIGLFTSIPFIAFYAATAFVTLDVLAQLIAIIHGK